MADLMQILADILQITPQQVSEYAAQGPLYQIFYLIFFPTLFIIFLIFIIFRIVSTSKKIGFLVAVAVYAFIVLQGYYQFFVTMSKYWLFGLLVLGFIYMLLLKFRPGAEGAKAKSFSGGGVINFLEDMTGKKLNPAQVMKLSGRIDRDVKKLVESKKALEENIRHSSKGGDSSFLYQQLGEVDQAISTLRNFKSSGAWGDYEDWRKNNESRFSL